MDAQMNDPVSHPAHYTAGKIEVIDFLDDQQLPFALANVIKYVCRAGKKTPDPIEDLEKAAWYLNHHIEWLKKQKANSNDAARTASSSARDAEGFVENAVVTTDAARASWLS